jgi:hypothetical protein
MDEEYESFDFPIDEVSPGKHVVVPSEYGSHNGLAPRRVEVGGGFEPKSTNQTDKTAKPRRTKLSDARFTLE